MILLALRTGSVAVSIRELYAEPCIVFTLKLVLSIAGCCT